MSHIEAGKPQNVEHLSQDEIHDRLRSIKHELDVAQENLKMILRSKGKLPEIDDKITELEIQIEDLKQEQDELERMKI